MNAFDSRTPADVVSGWVHDHGDALFARAWQKTASHDVAQDLVQETYLAALHHFSTFRGESQPRTWLMAILNRKITDHFRQTARAFVPLALPDETRPTAQTDGFFNENDAWGPTGHEARWEEERHLLDDPEFVQILKKCIAHLPERWRLAVQAKFLLEKSAPETCQELEVTPSNYWQMIHRAKLMLKKCLESAWTS